MNLLGRRRVLLDYLAGALWVLPTVSVVVFLLAGAVLSRVEVDDDSPLAALAFQGTAEDARSLLVVVSSTMITVTGLVFALTIVALQIASGQYSPRLLRNFMRDRGTQLVLSIFVGAFAYSTAGLYTVGIQTSGRAAFVPRLAVSGSLALALASVGVLIYFIHHLARSIQIDTIMGQVEREAGAVIDDVYPTSPATGSRRNAARSRRWRRSACPRPAPATSRPSTPIRWSGRPSATTWWSCWPGRSATTSWPARRSPGPGAGRPVSHRQGPTRCGGRSPRPSRSGSSGPWCRTSASVCAGWSTSPTRPCHRPSTTPTPASRRTAQIRRFGAAEPPLTRSLIQLLRDVGTSTASEARRAACAHHLWLVLEDAKRETAQPDDLQAVVEDGAAALSALGADHPQRTSG